MEENKNEYRFDCRITDEETGEPVISASTYVSEIDQNGSCESVEMELYSMLRAFKNKIREQHEKEKHDTQN